jgi:hypothetical protein
LEFADNVFSNSVVRSFNSSQAIWLTDDEMMQLYPSQNIIWALIVDSKSSSSSSNAVITISGYGTAG